MWHRVCLTYVDPIASSVKYKLLTKAYKAHILVPAYVPNPISPLS